MTRKPFRWLQSKSIRFHSFFFSLLIIIVIIKLYLFEICCFYLITKKKSNEWINEWGNARNEWAGDVTSPTHSKAKKTQIVWKMTSVTASGRCHLLRSSFRAVLGQVQCNYPAVSVDLLYRWICTSFLFFSEQFQSSSGSVTVQFQSSSGSVSVDLMCWLIRSSLLNLEQFKSSSGSVTGQFQCSFRADLLLNDSLIFFFSFLVLAAIQVQFRCSFGAVPVDFYCWRILTELSILIALELLWKRGDSLNSTSSS